MNLSIELLHTTLDGIGKYAFDANPQNGEDVKRLQKVLPADQEVIGKLAWVDGKLRFRQVESPEEAAAGVRSPATNVRNALGDAFKRAPNEVITKAHEIGAGWDEKKSDESNLDFLAEFMGEQAKDDEAAKAGAATEASNNPASKT